MLGIATAKGSRGIAPEADGGVGGFFCWNKMFGAKQMKAIIASIIISLNVTLFPYSMLAGLSMSGLYPVKTKPGMRMPMTSETFKTKVNS